ncbi:MAG TPA: DUF418 domain-containing protein [Vicinamibacterales bacterium]|nr:DUF418 domain-containing protein [Vicinamibacterales bacterium]
MTAAPVGESDRLVAMDVLRGFVLLGILVMNIQSFSMPMSAYMNPTAYGDLTGANLWVWAGSHLFFDQKFITVFSMLFGAGILLMTSRAGDGAGRIHRRRMGWLILFGLLHAHLFWYGDILYWYGMVGLVAYLFRNRAPRTLLAAAAVLILIGSLVPVGMGLAMPPETLAEIRDKDWQPAAAVIAAELAAYRGGPLAQAAHRSPTAFTFETFYLIFMGWKVLGLMLIGMALLKLDVFTARRDPASYAKLAGAGFAIGLPLVAFGMRQNWKHGWSVEYSMFFGAQWNYWGSAFVSLGYIGLFMWIVRTGALAGLTARLAAVGRMAFSNYIFQTIAATTIFYGHGLGLFGSVERTAQLAIVLAVWTVQLIASPIWLRHYQFGPLEWIWRSLTYGASQPMRRSAKLAAAG